MDDEALMIINNLFSLLQELKQVYAGGGNESSNEIEESMNDDNDDDEKVEMAENEDENGKEDDDILKLKKALIQTNSDGETGNSKAEEIIEEKPENSEKAIELVAKQLYNMLNKKSAVKKSAKAQNNNNSSNLLIAKALKQLTDRVVSQDKAITSILKGLGVADEIMKKNPEPKPVQKGLNNAADINASLAYIMSQMQNNKVEKEENHIDSRNKIRKTLGTYEVLKGMVAGDRR